MFEINNLTDEKIEELKYLDEVIKYTLKCENAIDAELDVIIVDNEYIHKRNIEVLIDQLMLYLLHLKMNLILS